MKKVFALLLACMLLFSVAMAENASKSTNDVTETKTWYAAPEMELEVVPATEAQLAVLAEITALVESGAPAITYFPAETQEQVAAVTSVEDLELVEFISLALKNYTYSADGLKLTLTCATPFADGATVVALLGLYNAQGDVAWELVQAKAVNGKVEITLTAEQVAKMAVASAISVAILTK